MKYESRRSLYQKIQAQLDSEISSFLPVYRDIADYIRPQRYRPNTSDRNRGDRRNLKIIDSTATIASRNLRSGMMSGITSPARPWFRLSTPDSDLAEFGPVKDWLHTVTTRMRTVYSSSNYYNVKPIVYGDVGDFGTGCYFMEKDFDDVIRCYPMAIGSYRIACDHRRKVNTFFREFSMTVRQVVHRFGRIDEKSGRPDWSNISAHVQRMYEEGMYEQWVDVCHIIQPNDTYEPSSRFAKLKKFASCYYEKGTQTAASGNYMTNSGDEAKLLEEKGYDYFPVLCARWETSGEDVYGTSSPGIDCIGDVKQLQTMEKRAAQAIEKMVNPPMKGPSSLQNRKASTVPGDITYLDTMQGQQGFEPVHEVNPRLLELENKAEQVRSRIKKCYFEDLFLMLDSMDRAQVTATEINERREEKLLALGPVLEQLNADDLDPGIDITFYNMQELGMIPPPPEELQGQPLKVDYVSYMHQALKAQGIAGQERFLGFASNIIAMDPNARHKVNFFQLIDSYGDSVGINPKIIRTDDEVDELVAQEQKQMQMQNAMAAMQQGATTAKDLSQASMSEDNALTQLVNAGNAGNIAPGI